MKKRIVSMAAVVCLALSLSACGGGGDTADNTAQETTGQTETAETADTADTAEGMTLEDYFNSDVMQAMVNAAKEQYSEEGIEAEMYAEGDELRYVFTMTDVETTEDERAVLAEALKVSTESSADSFIDTAKQAKEVVTNDEVIVVVTYMDGAGNELYSQSFSSADAE